MPECILDNPCMMVVFEHACLLSYVLFMPH